MAHFITQIEGHKRDSFDCVQKIRSIYDRVEGEQRELNPEERSEIDKLNGAISSHETRISELEKYNNQEAPTETPVGEVASRSRRFGSPAEFENRSGGNVFASAEYRSAFNSWLKTGELRDVVVGTATAGGNLIAPVQLSEDIVKSVDKNVYIRQIARLTKLSNAQAYGQRTITARLSDPSMMTEVALSPTDSSPTFGRRDLTPNLGSRTVLVSNKMLFLSEDIVPLIQDELVTKFSELQENLFLNGNGTGQPMGVFYASPNGVPTSQDVTGTGTGTFVADDLIKMRYSLNQNYLASPKTRWVFHRDIAAKIRTMKDSGTGAYVWQPGLVNMAPDRLLDLPVLVSDFAPNTLTSGSYVIVLGDFDKYAIAEVRDLQILRLNELYAANHEVGFQGSWFFDGAPIFGPAFCRLKTG